MYKLKIYRVLVFVLVSPEDSRNRCQIFRRRPVMTRKETEKNTYLRLITYIINADADAVCRSTARPVLVLRYSLHHCSSKECKRPTMARHRQSLEVLRNPQPHRDRYKDNVLFLGASLTDVRKVKQEQEPHLSEIDIIQFEENVTPQQLADLVQDKRMEQIHGRDTVRAIALERIANANVYTANDKYTTTNVREDRHFGCDWNCDSVRGIAGMMRDASIYFSGIYMDYIYLAGETYDRTAMKDKFFTVALPAMKEQMMRKKTVRGRLPAIYFPATRHILSQICCHVDVTADKEFSYSLLTAAEAKDKHLLFKATREIEMNRLKFHQFFGGKDMDKTPEAECKYDKPFQHLLTGHREAMLRLYAMCGSNDKREVVETVNSASFIKIERIRYRHSRRGLVNL